MKNKKSNTFLGWLKERVRKFFVALKKNPQSIPIASLAVTFLHYSLNLTHISNTTAKLQGQNMGLAAFITMLFLILSFVCMLSAFPKRQKPKLALIIVMVVLYGAVIYADIHYMGCIVNALYRPVDPIAPVEYIFTAYNTVLINIILVAVTILLVLTEPLYAKLIKKIKTSIEVESSGDIEAIDISGED